MPPEIRRREQSRKLQKLGEKRTGRGAPEDTQGSLARWQASWRGGREQPQRSPTGPVMLLGTTPCYGAGTEKQEPPGSPHTCLGL